MTMAPTFWSPLMMLDLPVAWKLEMAVTKKRRREASSRNVDEN